MDFLNTGQAPSKWSFSYCLERPAGGRLPAGCQKINPVKSLEGFGVSSGSRRKKLHPKENNNRKYGELRCVKSPSARERDAAREGPAGGIGQTKCAAQGSYPGSE